MIGAQHSLEGRQRSSVERLGLLILPLVAVEECQVIDGAQSIGVLWPQHTLVGVQRASVERLGLLVLALVPVEDCQVIEGTQGVGMLSPQHTLTDRQVPCPEWFCLPVLASLIEVKPGLKEQVSRFPKGHAPVVNMCGTDQRMWDQALTAWPCLVVHLWEALLHRAHDAFCP